MDCRYNVSLNGRTVSLYELTAPLRGNSSRSDFRDNCLYVALDLCSALVQGVQSPQSSSTVSSQHLDFAWYVKDERKGHFTTRRILNLDLEIYERHREFIDRLCIQSKSSGRLGLVF